MCCVVSVDYRFGEHVLSPRACRACFAIAATRDVWCRRRRRRRRCPRRWGSTCVWIIPTSRIVV